MTRSIYRYTSLLITLFGVGLRINTASADTPKTVKVLSNTNFSSFQSLYVEKVDTHSVSYGEAGQKAMQDGKTDKGLREAKTTLPEAAGQLSQKIKKEVDYLGIPTTVLNTPPTSLTDQTLNLHLSIVLFDPGSRLKRAFLGLVGGGKVRVGVKGEFGRYPGSPAIVQFYHERYASWTYAGEGPKRLLLNAVGDIAKDVGKYMQDNWHVFQN